MFETLKRLQIKGLSSLYNYSKVFVYLCNLVCQQTQARIITCIVLSTLCPQPSDTFRRLAEIGMGVFQYLFSTLNLHYKADLGHASLLKYQELQGFNNKQQDLLHRNVLKVTNPVGAKCTGDCLQKAISSFLEEKPFHYLSNNSEINIKK